jgi:hypothetical protein
MLARLNNLFRTLVRKKNDVALVALWTLLISFVVIKIHWTAYSESFMLRYFEIPFSLSQGPSAGFFDLSIIAVAAVIVGLFISDAKEMIYSFLLSTLFSFIIAVAYVTGYIWFTLGWGAILGSFSYDWEFAVYWAIATVFRIMFPWFIGVSLIGLVAAAFLRTWILGS